MTDFITQVKNNLISLTCPLDTLSQDKPIGVAVSGGADSVSLLVSLSYILKPYKIPLVAITVNHNIRPPKESAHDRDFVQDTCNRLKNAGYDVELFIKNLQIGEVSSLCQKRKKGIEEAARFLRYKAFEEAYSKYNLSYICLGHNSNDNLETVLMRFLKGSGIGGLSGILKVRNYYIRPLYNISRHMIESFLECEGFSYVTDSTNMDEHYLRNRIRHSLIPFLNDRFPFWQASVSQALNRYRLDEECLNDISNKVTPLKITKTSVFYDKSLVLEPLAISTRVLYKALGLLGNEKSIPFSFLCNFINSSSKGPCQFECADILFISNDEGLCIKHKEKIATESHFFAIINDSGVFDFPFGKVVVTVNDSKESAKVSFKNAVIDNIYLPFCIRSRVQTDYVHTKESTRLVSDVLASWHVDSSTKDMIPIVQELRSNEQRILYIIGSQLGFPDWIERYKS